MKRKADKIDSNPRPQKGKRFKSTSTFELSLVDLLNGRKLSRSAFVAVKRAALEQFCARHDIQTKQSGKYGRAVKDDFVDGILSHYVRHHIYHDTHFR
jgi:hypothetical protein